MIIHNENSKCSLAAPYYVDYLSDEKSSIPQDIQQHISGCDICLKDINSLSGMLNNAPSDDQKFRAKTINKNLELHLAFLNHPVTCSSARPFVPLQASEMLTVKTVTPITAHIDKCPLCTDDLNKIAGWDLSEEQLCRLSQVFADYDKSTDLSFLENKASLSEIESIINRRDSDISTILRIKNSDDKTDDNFDLEVFSSLSSKVATGQNHKFPSLAAKIIAVAACFIVIFMVFFNDSDLNATDFKEMYKSLKKVANICLTRYGIDNHELIQSKWISKSSQQLILKTDKEMTIYDLSNNLFKNKNLVTLETDIRDIPKEVVPGIKKAMDLPWGLLPFANSKDLPKGAIWKKVDEKPDSNFEVYELTWTQATSKIDVRHYLWRGYLEPDTKLPVKTEFAYRDKLEDEYELTSITEITYPEQARIKAVVDMF